MKVDIYLSYEIISQNIRMNSSTVQVQVHYIDNFTYFQVLILSAMILNANYIQDSYFTKFHLMVPILLTLSILRLYELKSSSQMITELLNKYILNFY